MILNARWADAEQQGDIFLRRGDAICQKWLTEALETSLPCGKIRFDYTHYDKHISFLDEHPGISGWLVIDKLCYEGYEREEYLLISVKTDDGTPLDDDLIDRMIEIPATWEGECVYQGEVDALRAARGAAAKAEIERQNKIYFLQECDKLAAWSEDLKNGLQTELKMLDKGIREKNRLMRSEADGLTLAEVLERKKEITRLKKLWDKKRRELNLREDEIEATNERLQDEIRAKLAGSSETQNVITVRFEVR